MVESGRLRGHPDCVNIVTVSPDGHRILSGAYDGGLILWDRDTAQPIRRFKHPAGDIKAVAISPDGYRALSGGEDMIVRLWDLESGATIREFRGHSGPVSSVAFLPDGRWAYSCCWAVSDSAIRVWDLETGNELRRLEGHRGMVSCLAVSPDGRFLLSAGYDRQVIVWDPKTGAEIGRFRGHRIEVEWVAFMPDSRRAVSCSNDGTIRLWDVETLQEVRQFHGDTHRMPWVAVSPDGRMLLSADYEGRKLCLWDVDNPRPKQQIEWRNVAPHRGSFTPDGRQAVWCGSGPEIRLYRLQPEESGTSHSGSPVYLCDLQETQSSVGVGVLGKNDDLGYDPGGGADRRIIVRGVLARKGLSMHSTAPPTAPGYSFARYQLDGKYTSFHTAVAVNDSVRVAPYPGNGIVETPLTFSVVGDGRELWKSRPLQRPGESEPCTVDVTGVRQFEVRVTHGGGGAAHAVWVDPYVQ
jgi:hypothetical protein